jgi:spermidine synthase
MRFYTYITVFIAGFVTLGVELAAARLLGNVYGTSNFVWATIIGLILLYLSAGYFIGGRWADRSPHAHTFYTILAWGAFSVGLIPVVAQPLLRWAADAVLALNAPVAGGAFVTTLLLFSIPITLLGCVTPFATRLLIQDVHQAGQVSGRISAVSTTGSLLGTFLPVMVLIPAIGTRLTYLLLATLLLLFALGGLLVHHRRRFWWHLGLLPLLMVFGWWASSGSLKPTAGLLYEHESSYNLIQVVEHDQSRYLLLNEGQGIHSLYNPNGLQTNGTWDYFLCAPFFNAAPVLPSSVDSLAIVGLAAGTIAKQYTQVYGAIPIDGIEIDPEIVAVGQKYFALNEPNLNVMIGDARWELTHSPRQYAVIGIDAYRLPYIPWQLTTVEFFQAAQDHLTVNGSLVINVGRTPTDRRLIAALYTTLRQIFPSVHVMDVAGTFNSILVATQQPSSPQNLQANLQALPADANPLLRNALQLAVASLQPEPAAGLIFTDDRAPIEQLTNAIVLQYLLGDGLKMLTE